MTASLKLDGILEALADAVASRVLAKIIGRDKPPTLYSTNKVGPHLQGKSRRWFKDHVRKMPGARQVGRDWEITASDYEAWATAEDARRCRPATVRELAPLSHASEDEATVRLEAQRALKSAGFRRSR